MWIISWAVKNGYADLAIRIHCRSRRHIIDFRSKQAPLA
jgi:hypothetical protein